MTLRRAPLPSYGLVGSYACGRTLNDAGQKSAWRRSPLISSKPVSGQSINVDSSVAKSAFPGTNHHFGEEPSLIVIKVIWTSATMVELRYAPQPIPGAQAYRRAPQP